MCRSVYVVPSISGRCARQRHRNNVPADNPRTYYLYLCSIGRSPAGRTRCQIQPSSPHRVVLLGLCLAHPALVTLPDPDVRSHLANLVDLYEEYIASQEGVSHQVVSWQIKWQQQMEQHGKPASLLYHHKLYRTRQVCTQTYGCCCWCSAHCRSQVVRVKDHLAL